MEKVEITVLNNVKEDAIRNYRLFKWELVEEKSGLKETTLVFSRNNEANYYQDLVKLENRFNKVYSIPSWASYVLIGLTLIYVTTIMVLWLTHILNFEKSIIVLILAIPTALLLLLNVFLSFLRSRELMNHIKKKEEKYKIYQQKVDELTNKSQK